jgi:hypothetical protein
MAIWIVESTEARTWTHHHPELVEFGHPGMLFGAGCDPVNLIFKHTEIDVMNNVWYDRSPQRDALLIPTDAI